MSDTIETSRRTFLQSASVAGLSGLTLLSSGHAMAFSLEGAPSLRAGALPSADEFGRQTIAMNNLGERLTGSDAHRSHVENLAKGLKAIGLDVKRDTNTFSRWLARKWAGKLTTTDGKTIEIPATSYYPYSGKTGPEGVTGELVHIPKTVKQSLAMIGKQFEAPGDLKGKVVLIEMEGMTEPDWSKSPWGFNPPGEPLPKHISSTWGGITAGFLGDLKAAGVVGVILGWTNISDAQAMGQYTPYGRPFQDLPCIWVGRGSTAKLREAAGTGAKATVILEAEITENVATDTLYAVLPGMSSDSLLLVESHTDGMNFLEENGSLALVAMAKYFADMPKESRKRDILFLLPSRFAREDILGAPGWMTRHPEMTKKAAAFVTVEHLGCREWYDNAAGEYAPSGKAEITYAITDFKGPGDAMVESAKGGIERLAVVRGPIVPGEGGPFYRAGIPGIGFFPGPNYLLSFAPNGHIDKFSKTLMHAQIQDLTRVIQKLDGMSDAEIRAS
jgi:hypothetical protein